MADIREAIQRLPDSPGVYRFYNSDNELIYIGKAKSLKKRVNSYFTKAAGVNRKTLKLVSEISNIEYTVSDTEFDALLLENNFIKQNQPKYNILLKDDKTFPYICILKERFPRIIYTRKYDPQQGEYFGPYSSVSAMKNVLDLVRKLYSIRTCSLMLNQQNIDLQKFKVCLEYHIGNCKAPCVGHQTDSEYQEEIEQARNILKGDLSIVHQYFKKQMQEASENMEFERAQRYKEKLNTLERFQSKSTVVNRALTNIDVLSITSSEVYAYINYMQIKEGAIVFSKSVEIRKKADETDQEILAFAAQELRVGNNETVYSNIPITILDEQVENVVPKIGDKKKLVSLSLRNAMELQNEKQILREGKKSKQLETLNILQKDLQLPGIPLVIECFDNSNFQGTTPVASMVRFVNGKSDRKNYRHFNIKTVIGSNDFASMKEVVGRRYRRIMEEAGQLPDLIMVDGGKGQLSSACEALKELGIYGKIPIVGIAKKLEEIYYPEDPIPLHINKKSPGLLLMQQIRDEAHRFAITFHRQKRSKSSIKTGIEELHGIGKSTANKLLRHFKSVKKIREASFEEVEKLIGKKKAEIVKATSDTNVGVPGIANSPEKITSPDNPVGE